MSELNVRQEKKPWRFWLVTMMYVAVSWGVGCCQWRWAGGEMIGDRWDRHNEKEAGFVHVSLVASIPWQHHVGSVTPWGQCWRLQSVRFSPILSIQTKILNSLCLRNCHLALKSGSMQRQWNYQQFASKLYTWEYIKLMKELSVGW